MKNPDALRIFCPRAELSGTPFNSISVLLVEETGVPGENHRPAASHWQALSHNVVSRTKYKCLDPMTRGFYHRRLSLCTNGPVKKCLDWCISNSGTELDYEGKKKVRILFIYLFFCMNLGEINALLTISCCQMKHFGYVDQLDPNTEFRSVSLWIAHIEWNEMYWRNDWWIKMTRIVTLCF